MAEINAISSWPVISTLHILKYCSVVLLVMNCPRDCEAAVENLS